MKFIEVQDYKKQVIYEMENEVKEAAFKYNFISPQEYLAMERASEEKHEYYDGQVLGMAVLV